MNNNEPVISGECESLSMCISDRHQLAVGRGLSVGQLVDDVTGHDVPGEDVLSELVEDVELLRVGVRHFEDAIGLLRWNAGADSPEAVVALVGDVEDGVGSHGDGGDGAELHVGSEILGKIIFKLISY